MKRIALLLFAFFSALSAYCQSNLQDGDYCFDHGDYACAITKYKEAFKLSSGKDKQIAEIRLSRTKWCIDHVNAANQAFAKKSYQMAIENYQSVLDTNPNDSFVKEQLIKCNNILNPPATTLIVSKENILFPSPGGADSVNVNTNADSYSISMLPIWCSVQKYAGHFVLTCSANSERTTRTDYLIIEAGDKTARINLIQSIDIAYQERYSEINPKNFNDFVNINYNALNLLVKNCTNAGKLSYSALIQFDQQGNNQSKLTIHSISDKKFKSFLSRIKPSEIPPSRISNVFLMTKEILNFNLSWETQKTKAIVRSHKLKTKNAEGLDYNQKSIIESCISNHSYKSGIYTFNITRKRLNENNFNDIAFSSFTNNSGPMNVMYSLVLPGLGTSKVTNGDKGKGRMLLFLISSAISAGSRIYSINQYDKYLKFPANGSQNYTNADIANKAFLVSGGIAATFYLYDVFYVFGKGLKNLRENKPLKQELSVKPIILVNSPLKP